MNIPIDCPELNLVDSPPVPQTHVDLCFLEWRRFEAGKCDFDMALAIWWAAIVSHATKHSKN